MMKMFFDKDPAVQFLFRCAPTRSESCLFFRQNFFGLIFNRLRMMQSMTLLGWLVRLMVL